MLINNKANGGNGGGICALGDCTIQLNGDAQPMTVSGNTASGKGSGIYMGMYQGDLTSFPGKWTVNFYGANVQNDLYLDGNTGTVNMENRMSLNNTLTGNIYISNAVLNMRQGTINSPEVTADRSGSKLYISGGYCSISKFKTQNDAKVYLEGGYFDAQPTDPGIQVASGKVMLSIDENTGDSAYNPDYPWAVYSRNTSVSGSQNGTVTYTGNPVEEGNALTPSGADGATISYF